MNSNRDYMFLFLVLILILYIYKLHQDKSSQDFVFNKKLNMFKTLIDEYKIQLSESSDKCPVNINCPGCIKCQDVKPITDDQLIDKRDNAVVNNHLYPPLSRVPKPIATSYMKYKRDGVFDVSTRYNGDTYKLMAYLINSNDRSEKWNIFGRQKYSGSSQGEFFATQQCTQGPCTKIELSKDIIVGDTINDYYNLPNSLTFKSPLFSTHPYDVVQLKTSSGSSIYM